ncbi:choice-of-anchor I family protein [Salibacterium halotolerans]|uniref:S-layer homology domain-containing protein n=1 Tax=Salibacterium halotolerans TaxID=1884432 RepID=A0A1I5XXW7_9BACI|nr:choice-of-anchor I family protein [Salibacterium halotolerans]SFQ36793.1 S-layer homology domain-containing protein [Salibacterium halotolerans]
MKKSVRVLLGIGLLFSAVLPYQAQAAAEQPPFIQHGGENVLHAAQIAQYDSMSGEAGTEIMSYDAASEKAFVTNGAESSIDIVDVSILRDQDFQELETSKRVAMSDFGLNNVSAITSIAAHPTDDLVAVAVVSDPKTEPGHVVFLTKDGEYINDVEVGAQPDMVTFTPDGTKALTANEGEPASDYSTDPEGSVSMIHVADGAAAEGLEAETLTFSEDMLDDKVRTASEGTALQQLEPEYLSVSEDSSTAYAAMQENNAIAEINLDTAEITSVQGLGVKDYSAEGNELDGVENGETEIEKLPLLGLYMPDAIDTYTVDGQTYIVTPNEGDSRDYDAYSEEAEVGDVVDNVNLNADHYEGYTQEELDNLVDNGILDKLAGTNITTENGQVDGTYESLYTFGGRSFSIFNADTMNLVYDSGSEMEDITADAVPEHFNTDNEELAYDGRSDSKGPEPESSIIGEINGKTYAFTGMERFSGVMVYDVTNPAQASFVTMISSRDFTEDIGGDVAPEGLTFIHAEDSPTGSAILGATHELTGTVAFYEFTAAPGEEEAPEEEDNTPDPGENAPVFEDVADDYWAQPYIKNLHDAGIVQGHTDGTFGPSEDVTRAQFAVMLSRMLDLDTADTAQAFEDVPTWAADEVNALHEAGITTGKEDGSFDPQASITREQMAAMAVRAYEHEAGSVETADVSYEDSESISPYAQSVVEKASALELMTGTEDNLFQPKKDSTRAHAAKVVSMLHDTLEQ